MSNYNTPDHVIIKHITIISQFKHVQIAHVLFSRFIIVQCSIPTLGLTHFCTVLCPPSPEAGRGQLHVVKLHILR
jgi:predicted transcriptional regulator